MGFLDKIKQQATDVASTVVEKTQETAKTGQLQIQLRSLKNDERDALAEGEILADADDVASPACALMSRSVIDTRSTGKWSAT